MAPGAALNLHPLAHEFPNVSVSHDHGALRIEKI